MTASEVLDLSKIIEPLQSYFLSSNLETNILTDPGSVSESFELLEKFGGTACGNGYDGWAFVNFYENYRILKDLSDGYKASHSAMLHGLKTQIVVLV